MAGKFSKSQLSQQAQSVCTEDAPAKEQPGVSAAGPSRKRPRTSTLIFYTAYVTLVLLFIVGMFFTMNSLEQKLTDFEASQPGHKSAAVFEELFADPDWATLYDLAGIEDTAFEGRDAYAAYMSQKTAGQPLSYQEASTDIGDSMEYNVMLADTPIGSFTLVRVPETKPTQWELNGVTLTCEYGAIVRIRKLSGHTVYVNGVELDDSYTTHIGSTTADEYLPRGIYNVWIHTQQVSGLLIEPAITATDELGQSVEVLYDEKTDTYFTSDSTNAIGSEERELALDTLKAYVQFMVDGFSFSKLGTYFDTESDLYNEILTSEPWLDSNLEAQFENEAVTGFCRYSDELLSARVSLTARATRVNGTLKEFAVEKSLVFQKGENGWYCVGITDRDLSQLDQSVRITFMVDDTVLFTEFYDTDLREITTPLLSNSDGRAVTGWYREEIDGNGMVQRILVFTPDSDGNASIPEGTPLEPMTLYAQYDDIPTEK